MAFPDNSTSLLLPHHVTKHYPEQSEFEDKGGINPLKSDTDSKPDQPQHQQRVQAGKYIDGYPSLLMDRKSHHHMIFISHSTMLYILVILISQIYGW